MNRRFLLLLGTFLCAGGLLSIVGAAPSQDVRQSYLDQFQAGESAFGQNAYPTAIQHFQQALQLQPGQPRPRFRLAQSLQMMGRYEDSLGQFQALLEKYPNHIEARVCLAGSLIGMKRSDDARQQLEWILRVQPEHPEARRLLASLQSPASAPPAGFVKAAALRPMPGTAPVDGPEVIPDGFQPLPVKKMGEMASGRTLAPPAERPAPVPAKAAPRPVPPPAAKVPGWKVNEFLDGNKESFGLTIEYAKFCLEKDELDKAVEWIDRAEKMAIERRDTRRFLEVQIHRSLLLLYRQEIRGFGQQLIKIKPMLSGQTYASFLDIYNRAQGATSTVEVSRLVAGVAMGAEHFCVAARIFAEVVQQRPNDLLAHRLLAEAQLEIRDFAGAERTLLRMASLNPKDPEVAFNLARFYLTARFDPDKARRCADQAAQLGGADPRVGVLLGLLEFSQGKINAGLARLRQLLPAIRDQGLEKVCRRIISDGEASLQGGGNRPPDFSRLLALPGTPQAPPESLRYLGDDFLKRGSFFLAMKVFHESRDLAEIGRTYLALASHLFAIGDEDTSAVAAGYGLNALNEDLRLHPESARSRLYLALYHMERRDRNSAHRQAQAGLSARPVGATRRQLQAVLAQNGG